MSKQISCFPRVLFLLCAALPAFAADIVLQGGGTLAHIVGGGPWVTAVTLVNLTGGTVPYILHFIGDDGQPMTLATTAGNASELTGNLGSGASFIFETNGPTDGPVQQGWAYVETEQDAWIAGSAVFRLTIPDSPIYEASLPLDTGIHKQFGLPFDHVDATTGFAMANSFSNQAITVTLTFYDEFGTQFFSDTVNMAGLTHQAFMLPDRYPQVAGKRGLALVTSNGFINVVGLRARGGGFTTITPLVLQDW